MTITIKEYPQLKPIFDDILEYEYGRSYDMHRRGSTFYRRSIVLITKNLLAEYNLENRLDLIGYWETDQYLWDDSWGIEDGPSELVKVKPIQIYTTTWETIEEEKPHILTKNENEVETKSLPHNN